MATSLRRRGGTERARTTTPLTTAPGRSDRRAVALTVAVAAVVVVGVALRFLTSSHLWLDEALTVNIAKLPLSRIPDALRHDGSPPLYYLLLHWWIAVFGAGDIAVRALSAVFAIATLPLIWLAGQRLGGRRVAVAALVLLASSPFASRFATEARMYSLLGLLAVAGYLCLQRLIDRPSLGSAAGVAVASGLLLLTHYWSIYLLATVALMILVRARRRRDRGALLPLAAMAAGGLLFVPWLADFAYQVTHTGTPWAGVPTFKAVIDTVRSWAGGGGDAGELLNLIFVALAVLAVFGLAVDRRHVDLDLRTRPGVRRLIIACIGTLLLGLLAADALHSAYVVRYTSVAFPLFILVAAFGTLVFVDNRVRIGVLALAVQCDHRPKRTGLAGRAGDRPVRCDAAARRRDERAVDVGRLHSRGRGFQRWWGSQRGAGARHRHRRSSGGWRVQCGAQCVRTGASGCGAHAKAQNRAAAQFGHAGHHAKGVWTIAVNTASSTVMLSMPSN